MRKNKVLCIIPARGGSKGIKLKNLQKIDGKPLIFYVINAAQRSKVIDDIFVSTDSNKNCKRKKIWSSSSFLRKKKFSGDLVSTENIAKCFN